MGITDFVAEALVLLDQALHFASEVLVLRIVLLNALFVFVKLLEGL